MELSFPKTTFIPVIGEEAKEEACYDFFSGDCDPSRVDETPCESILWLGDDEIPSDLLPNCFEHEILRDIGSERSS